MLRLLAILSVAVADHIDYGYDATGTGYDAGGTLDMGETHHHHHPMPMGDNTWEATGAETHHHHHPMPPMGDNTWEATGAETHHHHHPMPPMGDNTWDTDATGTHHHHHPMPPTDTWETADSDATGQHYHMPPRRLGDIAYDTTTGAIPATEAEWEKIEYDAIGDIKHEGQGEDLTHREALHDAADYYMGMSQVEKDYVHGIIKEDGWKTGMDKIADHYEMDGVQREAIEELGAYMHDETQAAALHESHLDHGDWSGAMDHVADHYNYEGTHADGTMEGEYYEHDTEYYEPDMMGTHTHDEWHEPEGEYYEPDMMGTHTHDEWHEPGTMGTHNHGTNTHHKHGTMEGAYYEPNMHYHNHGTNADGTMDRLHNGETDDYDATNGGN